MSKHVLVNKQLASGESGSVLVPNATLTTPISSPSALTDGQLAIFNAETNTAITNGSAPGLIPFYVGMGVPAGRNPRVSPVIKAGAVKKIEFKAYTQPVQPVYYVGYKPAAGGTIGYVAASGTATVSYGIKIENLVTLAPPFPKAYSQYTMRASVGTANNNQVFVADQLAKDLNSQLAVLPTIDGGQFALVETVVNTASTGIVTSGAVAITGSITTNSNVLTLSGTPSPVLAVNDWIRIGAGTVSADAANTVYGVYQIAGTSGNTITLTKPYAGVTGATLALGSIANTAIASALVGLRIAVTGSYFTSNNYAAGKLNMMINIPLMDTLAGTPIQVATLATEKMVYGSGTVSEVLKKEMQALGELGVENRIWMPLPNDTYAASNVGTGGSSTYGNGYGIFTLYYENSVADKSAQGQGRVESGMLDICVNNYYTGTTVQGLGTFGDTLASLTGIPYGSFSVTGAIATFSNW